MDKLELLTVLAEYEIPVPERCSTCPRLGDLATTLSLAHENKASLVTGTEQKVLTANLQAQLSLSVAEGFPDATEDQVADIVRSSVSEYFASERYIEFLKDAGSLMVAEDEKIESSLSAINSLLNMCPPEGCLTSSPE